jgi:hypothetical protein
VRRLAGIGVALMATAIVAGACGSDADGDAGPVCSDGTIECSDDGYQLKSCVAGQWQITHCMRDELKLCEAGACVDPWRYGSPSFDDCADEPLATAESLAEKAAGYEDLAKRLHVHPDLGWMLGVTLPCDGSDCTQPGVAEADATWQDVEAWRSGENDGLWSALYLTAEAYRYAVTGDADALAMLELLLEGQRKRMAITGVSGLYTRQLIPPGIAGLSCPADLESYIPDAEKDDNQWVRVGDDGCVQTVDPASMQFVSSDHCGLDEFAGWCWLDNVSQDEYSGHMLAHAAVARLVDDPGVQALNAQLAEQVGLHMMHNDLIFHDWDGRPTEHGYLVPTDLLGGYRAAMSLAFVKTAAASSGNAELQAFVDDCMLAEKNDDDPCVGVFGAATRPYHELVDVSGIYLGCASNWNNFSMHMLSLHTMLLLEGEPEVRRAFQDALRDDMFEPAGVERPLREQNNAFFDFIYAADKHLGPGSDGPALAAVENGLCRMRQFPASQQQRAVSCPAASCVEACRDRFDRPMTDYPRPVAERCTATFMWWGSPYSVAECDADPRNVRPPADYLLPYWMGRYYGFIDTAM